MKKIFILSILFVCLLPVTSFGQQRNLGGYFAAKAGAFFPSGDLDDAGFDTGFSGELVYGHYLSRNFALELGAGYYQTQTDFSGVDPLVGPFSADVDVRVVPLTVTAKGVVPLIGAELYAGVGGGVYLANFEIDVTALGVRDSVDDDDAVVGGHILAGANINVSPFMFLGVEGKYIFTDDADFNIAGEKLKTELNGFVLTANLGIRF